MKPEEVKMLFDMNFSKLTLREKIRLENMWRLQQADTSRRPAGLSDDDRNNYLRHRLKADHDKT